MLTPPVLAYCSTLFINSREAQKKVGGRIADVEMSLLSFGAIVRAVCVDLVESLSFSRLNE